VLSRLVSLCSDWVDGVSMGSTDATRTGGQGSEPAAGTGTGGGVAGQGADEASLTTNGSGDAVSNGNVDGGTGAPTAWQDLLSGETVSKQEVQVELGLQPHEFLAWLVRSSGGRMWQADVVDTTGWSKSTVSRYLDTLESNDVVERVRIGRRKLVGVPEEMPVESRTPDGPGEVPEPFDESGWADEAI
jgi:hypothetical protein